MEDMDKYQTAFNQGSVLMEEGETGDHFFLLKEGLVKIVKEVEEDDERVVLANLGPGEMLGELALMDETDIRSATALADTRVVCWKLNEKQFNHLMETQDSFRQKIFQSVSDRLRKTNQRYAHTHKIEKLLYQCSFIVLYLLEKENWYTPSKKEISITPSFRALKSRFDIEDEVLESFLSTPTYEELQGLPSGMRNAVSEATKKMVKETLENLDMELPVVKPSETGEEEISELQSTDSLISAAERLCAILDNTEGDLNRDQYRSLYKEYKQLKDQEDQLAEGSYPQRRLGAFLESARRHLKNIKPSELEDESEET